jgi:hypothetical protein
MLTERKQIISQQASAVARTSQYRLSVDRVLVVAGALSCLDCQSLVIITPSRHILSPCILAADAQSFAHSAALTRVVIPPNLRCGSLLPHGGIPQRSRSVTQRHHGFGSRCLGHGPNHCNLRGAACSTKPCCRQCSRRKCGQHIGLGQGCIAYAPRRWPHRERYVPPPSPCAHTLSRVALEMLTQFRDPKMLPLRIAHNQGSVAFPMAPPSPSTSCPSTTCSGPRPVTALS